MSKPLFILNVLAILAVAWMITDAWNKPDPRHPVALTPAVKELPA